MPSKYGDDRMTEIQDVEDEIDIEDLIEEEECVFTLTENGYIKRTAVSEYTAQSKGGMGKKGIITREEDTVVDVFTASTHDYLLFFTDTGKVYRKKGYQIPESGKTARGHQHRQYPAGGAGGEDPDHAPLPGGRGGPAVPLHDHP